MNVAILGFGKEGQSALRYYREKGAKVTVFDENSDVKTRLPAMVGFKSGKNCFEHAQGYDVVVRGPAIRSDRIRTDGEITDVTQVFFF